MIDILLVEPDALISLAYERELQPYGLQCTHCFNAATALEACRRTVYPLIIQELLLPDMDGLEFCRRIRELPYGQHSKILVISGYIMRQNSPIMREAGADEFLSKPVDPARLIHHVSALFPAVLESSDR